MKITFWVEPNAEALAGYWRMYPDFAECDCEDASDALEHDKAAEGHEHKPTAARTLVREMVSSIDYMSLVKFEKLTVQSEAGGRIEELDLKKL